MLNTILNGCKRVVRFQCTRYYSVISSTEYREQTVEIDKWNINYLKIGNGPNSVLFSPGMMGTKWTDFRSQIKGLDQEKFTLVFWDPPGCGKSRPPEYDFPLYYSERGADQALQLVQALNIEKFSLVGWSLGGMSSIVLAAKYPELVNKLVLIGTVSFFTPQEIQGFKVLKDLNLWKKDMRDAMTEVYGEKYLIEYWSKWCDVIAKRGSISNGHIITPYLEDVRCPTLITHGAKDRVASKSHAWYLNDRIRNSRVHLYPQGKHDIHLAYSEDFNKRIEDFLLSSSDILSDVSYLFDDLRGRTV